MNTPTYPAHVAYTETLPPPLPDGYIRVTGGAWVPVQVVGGDALVPGRSVRCVLCQGVYLVGTTHACYDGAPMLLDGGAHR